MIKPLSLQFLPAVFIYFLLVIGSVLFISQPIKAAVDEPDTNTTPTSTYNPLGNPCSAANSADSDVCKDYSPTNDPINGANGIFTKAVNILSFLAGIIAVIIIIIAGITMMTSQGESNKIKSSRDAIIYAAIGIVVIVLARTIVIFVFNRV